MRVSLVHNAQAGVGDVTRKQLLRALEEAGHTIDDDPEVVIAAGGDATVARVAEDLIGSVRPLVIVPIGTANNLARGVGQVPARDPIEQLLSVLQDHDERALDVGTVGDDARHFYEGAGTGLFADALERLFTEEDKQPERAARVLAGFLERRRSQPFDVRLDEIDVSGEYTMIEVMNVGMLGPNLHLGRDADPFDGLLDVALVTDGDIARLHDYLVAKGSGRTPPAPAFDVQRVRRVELGLGEAQLRIDGILSQDAPQHSGPRRVVLGVLPGAVRLWTPRAQPSRRQSSSTARNGR